MMYKVVVNSFRYRNVDFKKGDCIASGYDLDRMYPSQVEAVVEDKPEIKEEIVVKKKSKGVVLK